MVDGSLQVSVVCNGASISAHLVKIEAGKAWLYKNFIGWPKPSFRGPPPSLPLVQAGAAANGQDMERRPTAETPSG